MDAEARAHTAEATDAVSDAHDASATSSVRELATIGGRFWEAFLRVASLVSAAGLSTVLVYYVLTRTEVNRTLMVAAVIPFALVAVAGARWAPRIAASRARASIAATWVISLSVLLATLCYFNGGLDSPLAFLLILPLAAAPSVLPTGTVVAAGVVTVGEVVALYAADPSTVRSTGDLAMLLVSAVTLAVFAGTVSAHRRRRDHAEIRVMRELVSRSTTDALTECLTYGEFYARLGAEVARATRSGESLCMIMVDLDLFKSFNDAFGHAAGDLALHTVGAELLRCRRPYDLVGRVGGDEFALALPATDLTTAADLAERVHAALHHPEGLPITASVGCATLQAAEPTTARLVRDADDALYEAKLSGRDQSVAHVDSDRAREIRAADTMLELANARVAESRVRLSSRIAAERLAILEAFESAPEFGLAFVGTDYRLLLANRFMASLSHYAEDDFKGKPVAEIVPELWPRLKVIFDTVIATGEPVTGVEIEMPLEADGERRFVRGDHYPVRVAGETIGVAVVLVDVTSDKRLESHQASVLRSLVLVLADVTELRDPYTAGHQSRVSTMSRELAVKLGLDESAVQAAELTALIHDVGKTAVPAEILAKPGPLTSEEWTLVQCHSSIGADLLAREGFPADVVAAVRSHHERMDGSGYPDGLRGHEIPMASRIIAVADAYDAMATNRPYRPALGDDLARRTIEEGAGTAFDPSVVAAFSELLDGRRASVLPPSDSTPTPQGERGPGETFAPANA